MMFGIQDLEMQKWQGHFDLGGEKIWEVVPYAN